MIEENRIYFGYGTIAVGSSCGMLRIEWIKPPQEIGQGVPYTDSIKRLRTINFEWAHDIFKLRDDLNRLEELNNVILFRGYLLDFRRCYNVESVRAVQTAIDRAIEFMLLPYAC